MSTESVANTVSAISPYPDTPSVTPEDFLDVAGVCSLLHLDPRSVYRAVHQGRLPVMRFGATGRVWRFYKPDVLKLREIEPPYGVRTITGRP